uniref:Uncharacterized protein n=1 Tax=Kalanchoe fedtschenkoi TaxID=63787 RepID=A0A7N0V2A1_KALFE
MSRKQQQSSEVAGNEKLEVTQKAVGSKAEATENDEVSEPGAVVNDGGSKPGVSDKDDGVKSEAADKGEGLKKAEGKPTGETEVKPKKKKKKSVEFQKKVDEDLAAPRTPLVQTSSVLRKPRRSVTPYHTARNCSRCGFDKLGSSSYWIGQIKLAESVGKHFVSVAFFQLAHECNAEPVRGLKIELKKYLSRHGHLGKQQEWIEASRKYGSVAVSKDEDKRSGEKADSRDRPNPETDSNVVTSTHEPGTYNTA